MSSYWKIFTSGILINNPVFCLVLGLCPALAVTTSLENAIGMGIATIFVLAGSSTIVSLVRSYVPHKIRIPCYIIVIATFTTIAELLVHAYQPTIYTRLGIYLPLIVVNCIVLGRAEAFAANNKPIASLLDALGIGLGFALALIIIGSLREILATRSIILFGNLLLKTPLNTVEVMNMAPGAFLTVGLILALLNIYNNRVKN